MNWLDNLIGFVSPKTAYKRQAYRNAIEASRAYDAANYKNANANWHASIESAEMGLSGSREIIRARARDLENNSDIMNSILGAYKRNVVGAGYRLRANTGKSELDKKIESLWHEWTKARNCDVTGQQSLNQLLRMAITRKKVDGGILFIKCHTDDGIIPFQLQAIEVDELDTTVISPRNKENRVIGGIEYNQYGKPVGYYIRKYDIQGYNILDAQYYEAKDVIFMCSKSRPSQAREVSDMAQTLTRIRDINEFLNTIAIKERVLACLSVFITQDTPQTGIGGRSNKEFDGQKYNYQGKTLTPGMIQYLNSGDKVSTVQPTGQAVDATAFVKQQMRMVGSGQGVSYEVVSRDMSESNYSSARQGIIEDELTYQEDIEIVESFLDEVYDCFIASAYLSGKLTIEHFGTNSDNYLKHKWIKAPKRWIDPAKEANANKTALLTGEKTFVDLASEHGKDWRSQIDEMAEVQEYAKSKGVMLGGGENKNENTEASGNAPKVGKSSNPGNGGKQ